MLFKTIYASPLGAIQLLSGEHALLGLWFADQKYFGAHYDLSVASEQVTPILTKTIDWLDDYFAGNRPDVSRVPVAPSVTAYRQQVLHQLQAIPYGEFANYQTIANQVAKQSGKQRGAARAVGGAVGHNPLSIIIPCHRVIGSNGTLTGYAGGLDRKIALLELEGHDHETLLAMKK